MAEQRLQLETLEQRMLLTRKHREELEQPFKQIWEKAVVHKRPRGPIGTAHKVLQEWGCYGGSTQQWLASEA